MNEITKNIFSPDSISPIRMLVVLMCTVFLVELAIMVVLGRLMPMPEWIANLLDAFILTSLLFPALYYWIFRPMTLLIEKHEQAEAELLEIRDLLEHIADTRAQELESAKKATDSMLAEIEHLKHVGTGHGR
jgi:hypothetical protein